MNVYVEEVGICVCLHVPVHVCVWETQAEWCNM